MSLSVRAPFPDHAWPRVWQWIQPFRDRVTDDFAPKTIHEFVAAHIERAKFADTWGVWRGDELGGLIWCEHVNPVLVQSHVLFKREFWGRATTEAAIRQVYELVFARGAQKIGSYVFANNHAILSLAKALGAKQEGVLVNQTTRNGVPVNMIALGLLKEDFYASSINRGSDHGRVVAGGRSVEQTQDKHSNVISIVDARAAAHAGAARQRPAVRHHEPVEGLRAA